MSAEAVVPQCPEGHGMMVPVDYEFAYVPGDDGIITAVVEYISDPSDGKLKSYVNARLADGIPKEIPHPGEERCGERIQELRDSGKLVPFYEPKEQMLGFYRIDDDREGKAMSYLVWHATERLPGLSLEPGVIYGLYINGERDSEQVGDYPSSLTPSDLADMLDHYGITPITRHHQVEGLVNDDGDRLDYLTDEMVHNGKLRVWDIGALYRYNAGIETD